MPLETLTLKPNQLPNPTGWEVHYPMIKHLLGKVVPCFKQIFEPDRVDYGRVLTLES